LGIPTFMFSSSQKRGRSDEQDVKLHLTVLSHDSVNSSVSQLSGTKIIQNLKYF